MLRAGGGTARFQSAREGACFGRFREMARAERPSGEIEDGRQVDVDSGLSRALPVALPAASASFGLWNDDAGAPGGSSSNEARAPALLVDEGERTARARLASAPVLDDHARDALGRREARDHHEGRLLPRRQRRKIGGLLVAAGDKSESDLKQRAETHAT